MRTPQRIQRVGRGGFTLAELLVGLAVTSIVMTAVVAIFVGVQRSYQAETEVKQMTESGRSALIFLERELALAGYGIDPRLAFDLTNTTGDDNRDVKSLTFNPSQTALTGGANTIVTDDLAFRYRDPSFLRSGRLNVGSTQLTVDVAPGVPLPVGKLLMVGCRGATNAQMVRVTTASTATDTTIAVAGQGAPFIPNTDPCLQQTGNASPWVYMIQEHRIRIVNLGGRPWLVSFRDFTANPLRVDLNNFDLIAPDVEVFQVAFGMNRPRPTLACCGSNPATDTAGNWINGDTVGETFFAQPSSPLTTGPAYTASYDAPARFDPHPGNIRSVHLAMVLRSSRRSPNPRTALTNGPLFNHNAPAPTNDGYLRTVLHTAVNTPNLMSRTSFTPSIRTASETRDLNRWGG